MGHPDVVQVSRALVSDCCQARKTPAVAVQPAGLVLRVNIAAQGAYAVAVIAPQRPGKFAADGGVARSSEIDEENRALERGRKEVRTGADEVRHDSGASC